MRLSIRGRAVVGRIFLTLQAHHKQAHTKTTNKDAYPTHDDDYDYDEYQHNATSYHSNQAA
jgi:hypothetical protein